METASFRDLLVLAWRQALGQKALWVFGVLLALPALIQNEFLHRLPVKAPAEWYGLLQNADTRTLSVGGLIVTGLFLLSALGRGNLIAGLAGNHPKLRTFRFEMRVPAIWRNFLRAALADLVLFGCLFLLLTCIALPPLLAFWKHHAASENLLALAVLTALPIVVILYFTRIFTLLYFVLSPLSLSSAIENAYTLFLRYALRTLLFGIFVLLLGSIFTFAWSLVMLSFGAFLKGLGSPASQQGVLFFATLGYLTWFRVLEQALWVAFFTDIAGPQKPEEEEAEPEGPVVRENIPNTPSA